MDWHRDLGFLLYDVAQLYTRRFEARARKLALTESAKPVVERAWEMGRDTSTEALKGVTNDELHLLMDLLERVRANLLALAAEPVPAWRRGLRRRNSLRTVE
jgi:hypothetical protein